MSEATTPPPPGQPADLQFEKLEPAAAVATPPRPQCAACNQPIDQTYYAVGNKLVCPACRDKIVGATPAGSRAGRLSKAALFGIGAGLLGALIWFAVRKITHYEIGLIAVLLGWMVGKAVRTGSGNLGGRGYKVLAVALTYMAIGANYMPDAITAMIHGAMKRSATHTADGRTTAGGHSAQAAEPADGAAKNSADDEPADDGSAPAKHIGLGGAILGAVVVLVIAFIMGLAAPFMAGAANAIGLLLIAFAMWEAWKINARRQIPFSGPYSIGTRPPSALPAGVQS